MSEHGSELHRAGEWVGALVTLPSYVTGEGEPYRPTAVMWLDAETGCIVSSELVRPEEGLQRAAGLFHYATREPLDGPPRMPQRLRVSDEALAAALRGSIGDVELIVAETPEIDEVVASLREEFSRRSRESGGEEDGEQRVATFIGHGMSADDVGAMFTAAARLFRAGPWEAVPADEWLGVSCDLLGIENGVMTVVGQMGETFGYSLLSSVEDAVRYREAIEARERGEPLAGLPAHIMFSFEERGEIPDSMLDEVSEHGWDVAGPTAYPSPLKIDEDLVARALTRTELAGITAIMQTLAELVETEEELTAAWEEDDMAVSLKQTVATGAGDVTVELRAPLELPRDTSAAAWESIADESGQVDEDRLATYAVALIDEVAHVRGADGVHVGCADMLVEQAARFYGVPLTQLTPEWLEDLLFSAIPAEVAIEPDDAAVVVETVRLVMTLGAEKLGSARARACLDSMTGDMTERLARALADTSKYSLVKSMVMQGMSEGYDLSTEAGVAEWVDVLTQRSAGEATTTKKAAAKKKPTKARAKAKAAPKKKPAKAAKASAAPKKKPTKAAAKAKAKAAPKKKPANAAAKAKTKTAAKPKKR